MFKISKTKMSQEMKFSPEEQAQPMLSEFEQLMNMLCDIKKGQLEIIDILLDKGSDGSGSEPDLPVIPERDPTKCRHFEVDDADMEILCPLPPQEEGYCVNHIADYREFKASVLLYVRFVRKEASDEDLKNASKENRSWKRDVLEDMDMTAGVLKKIIKEMTGTAEEITNKLLEEL